MSVTLIDVARQMRGLEAEALDGADLTPEVLTDTLEALTGDFEQRAERMGQWVLELEADAKKLRERASAVEDRARRLQEAADRIKNFMLASMQIGGVKKVQLLEFTVTRRLSPESVAVHDAAAIPTEYMRQPPPVPDKTVIKEALKRGEAVPGCELQRNEHLRITI